MTRESDQERRAARKIADDTRRRAQQRLERGQKKP